MRILHIVPQEPSDFGGGHLVIAETVMSLAENNDIDYVGPEIKDEKYKKLYKQTHFLTRSHNIPLRIMDSLRGNTNGTYRSWLEYARNTNFESYDVIILEFTKLDYCVPFIEKRPFIVRVHNVEVDFARKNFHSKKSFENFAAYLLMKKRETKIINAADRLITLTAKDKKRLSNVYGQYLLDKTTVIPVTIKQPEDVSIKTLNNKEDLDTNKSVVNLLITGSLWYGPNYDGIKWVIKNVLPLIKVTYILTLAGAKPSEELKKEVEKNLNIVIADTPQSMAPYYHEADIVLIPVFDGAGMKVKVADAMAYGKLIVATPHALIGYSVKESEGIVNASDPQQFANKINEWSQISLAERRELSQGVFELYQRKYSITASQIMWEKNVEEVVNSSNKRS